MTKYQDLPIVEPTDPLWVEDEFSSLDDAIERFFNMPDADPDDIKVWPARRMPKPTLDDLEEMFLDYEDEDGSFDPLVEEACEAAEKAFRDTMATGQISMYEADWAARIDWRALPGADKYVAWLESRKRSGND